VLGTINYCGQTGCFDEQCRAKGGVPMSVGCVFGTSGCDPGQGYEYCYPQPPPPGPGEYTCGGVINCQMGQICGMPEPAGDGCSLYGCIEAASSSGGSTGGSGSSGGVWTGSSTGSSASGSSSSGGGSSDGG
jgi:hypothetical protein